MNREPMIVHCGKCAHEWAPCFLPAPVDVVAKVAKRPCPHCGVRNVLMGPVPSATADGDAVGWLANGDTGTSSLTIWHVLMGRPFSERLRPSPPLDPADFGRCYRLLQVMPSWRGRLGEVAERDQRWKGLVEHWPELESLYEQELPTGRCPMLYARMKALLGEAA